MSADLQERTAPDPGSPAANLALILDGALRQKKRAASATFVDWSGLDRACSFAMGADVKVTVTYRHGTSDAVLHQVERLDRVWMLADAGATLLGLSCPDEPLPVTFMAAAMMWDARGVQHILGVIDRRGGAGSLACRAALDGKKVGKVLRSQVMRYAETEQRKRAGSASKRLNRAGDSANDNANDVFSNGVAQYLLDDPTRRGIDEGRPLLQWWCKTVENGTEQIVAVSDPDFDPSPTSRAAMAGINALATDAWGRTKAQYLGSNTSTAPADGGEDTPEASEVVVRRVAPKGTTGQTGTCVSCHRSDRQLGGDNGDLCQECWKVDNAAGQRSIARTAIKTSPEDAKPSPVYETVLRAPDSDEMKPKSDDRRKWQDRTGELGSIRADHRLALEQLLGEEWSDELAERIEDLEIDPAWESAGLDDGEKKVLLLILGGFKQREIAEVIGRDQSAVSRITKRAKEKLQKS